MMPEAELRKAAHRIWLAAWAGDWLVSKVAAQVAASGARRAADNLRKQGCPFGLALRLIAGRRGL